MPSSPFCSDLAPRPTCPPLRPPPLAPLRSVGISIDELPPKCFEVGENPRGVVKDLTNTSWINRGRLRVLGPSSLEEDARTVVSRAEMSRSESSELLKAVPGFLTKTYDIFSREEHQEFCGWGSKGESIVIRQIENFSKSVLPKYFKHSNFQSFVRQLNMYDFRKTQQDPNHGEFFHPFFKLGRQDLLANIKRKANSKETTVNVKPPPPKAVRRSRDVVEADISLPNEPESYYRPPASKNARSSHISSPSSSLSAPLRMDSSALDTDPYLGLADDSGSFLNLDTSNFPNHLSGGVLGNKHHGILLREADTAMMELSNHETSRSRLEYRVSLLESSTQRLEGENLALKHMVEESRVKHGLMQQRMENVLRTLFNMYTKSGKLQGVTMNKMLEDAGLSSSSASSFGESGFSDSSSFSVYQTQGSRPKNAITARSSASDLGGHDLVKLSSFDTAAARITAPARPVILPGSKPSLERQSSLDWFRVKEDDNLEGQALTRQPSISSASIGGDFDAGLQRRTSSGINSSAKNVRSD